MLTGKLLAPASLFRLALTSLNAPHCQDQNLRASTAASYIERGLRRRGPASQSHLLTRHPSGKFRGRSNSFQRGSECRLSNIGCIFK